MFVSVQLGLNHWDVSIFIPLDFNICHAYPSGIFLVLRSQPGVSLLRLTDMH